MAIGIFCYKYMKENEVTVEVRFSEVDSMCIAHNSKYYDWFEVGRFAFTRDILGYQTQELMKEYRIPVIKSSCKYLYRILFQDRLCVKTYMYVNDSARLKYYYEIFNQNHNLCAVGSTEHSILDQNNKLLLKYDAEMREHFVKAKQQYPECFLNKEQVSKFENRINR